jgi:hypothetical protein
MASANYGHRDSAVALIYGLPSAPRDLLVPLPGFRSADRLPLATAGRRLSAEYAM